MVNALSLAEYEPPQGAVEQLLAGIWQELLQVPRIGREDNFFVLGGHSLMVAQVVSSVRESMGVAIEFKALFEKPTLEALAAHVEALDWGRHSACPPPAQGRETNRERFVL